MGNAAIRPIMVNMLIEDRFTTARDDLERSDLTPQDWPIVWRNCDHFAYRPKMALSGRAGKEAGAERGNA
jgi:hypothetical protein